MYTIHVYVYVLGTLNYYMYVIDFYHLRVFILICIQSTLQSTCITLIEKHLYKNIVQAKSTCI